MHTVKLHRAIICVVIILFYSSVIAIAQSNHNSSFTSNEVKIALVKLSDNPTLKRIGEKYQSLIIGTWKLDHLKVGDVELPADVIEGESLLRFFQDGTCQTIGGGYIRKEPYQIVGNVIYFPESKLDESPSTILKLTPDKLILTLISNNQESELVFVPKI